MTITVVGTRIVLLNEQGKEIHSWSNPQEAVNEVLLHLCNLRGMLVTTEIQEALANHDYEVIR